MLHPLPLPLSSCLGCIPPLIGLPFLRFYAVGSSLFLLSVCFCLCSLFYRDDVLCWLLLARPFLYAFHAHLRFPVDLVWFRLSCDHGWIRSGSVNVRKQQQQYPLPTSKLLQDPSLAHRQAMPNSRKRRGTWQREFCACGRFTSVRRALCIQQWWYSSSSSRVRARRSKHCWQYIQAIQQ